MIRIKPDSIKKQIFSFIVLLLFSTLISNLLFWLAITLIHDPGSASSAISLPEDPQTAPLWMLKASQAATTIGVFLLPPVFFYVLMNRSGIKFQYSSKKLSLSILIIVVFMMYLVRPLINFAAYFNDNIDLGFMGDLGIRLLDMSERINEQMIRFARADNYSTLLANIFVMALLPAVGEELFFRGLIQKTFLSKNLNYHLAIIVTSLIFSVFHFNVKTLIPIFILGMILGYIYHYSGNLWLSVIAHFINNASLLLIMFYNPLILTESTKAVSESVSLSAAIFSLLLTVMLLYFIYYESYIRKDA